MPAISWSNCHASNQLPEQLRRYRDDLQAELLEQGGLILLDGLDEVPRYNGTLVINPSGRNLEWVKKND